MRLTTLITVFVLVLLATFALGFMLGAQARSTLRQQQTAQTSPPTVATVMADIRRQQQMVAMAKAQNPFVKPATSVEGRLMRLTVGPAGPAQPTQAAAADDTADPPPNPLKGTGAARPAADAAAASEESAASALQPSAPLAPAAAAAPAPAAAMATDVPSAPLSSQSVMATASEGTMAYVLRPPPAITTTATAAAPAALPSTAMAAGAAMTAASSAAYSVEVARTDDSLWANALVGELLAAGEAAYLRVATLPDGRELTYIRVGTYPTADEAQNNADRLFTRHGLNAKVLRVAALSGASPPAAQPAMAAP